MINISVDENEVRRLYLEELKEHIKKVDAELIFWDTKELTKRTCMSLSTVQKEFFYDPRFPKRKVGGKWYFPVDKTKEFLLMWLDEHA
ncbi:group-specific protein [Peribacillus sp. NPDC097198]|uniref:group-specific protein n=1 Tax=Peribacillus sp. NPDC097198 TaxID=3364397 RepID=UPI0038271E80